MKKKFTLIELIIVIAVLGILTGIIIPNTSNFKKESKTVAYQTSIHNIQTAVDVYRINEMGDIPSFDLPIFSNPTEIDFSKRAPKYLRYVPEGGYSWIDYSVKVWL